MFRTAAVAALALCLAACASTPDTAWTPRSDRNLTADLKDCSAQGEAADLGSSDAYSNASFGAAAAAAGQIDRNTIRSGQRDLVFKAVRDSCMERKGWTRA